MTEMSPRTIVEEVVRLLSPEATMAGLEIVTRFPDKLPHVSVDPEVLRQALTNVVKNAIQAVPSRDGKILVGCRDGESEVRLYVHDTGPGMTDYVKSHAFDLYMTTKEGGTGVGLAYVLQAVEMHDGTVELSSQEGKGTTINLVLPTMKKHRRISGAGAMPREAS
jgi:signal transduction histidine kinase